MEQCDVQWYALVSDIRVSAEIGDNAFRDCVSLRSFTIPASVRRIGYFAFRDCLRLETVNLLGDPTKARTELGWDPAKTSFTELVKLMVEHDMQKVAVERAGERVKDNLEEYLEKGIIK